jgi:hypothetical protein
MKYYLHDTNSFNDDKITELYIKFGYEGLGLFYTILEKFANQEKPIKTIVLKKQLNIGKKLEKCWNFLEEIQLIQSDNGESFNERILNFAGKYKIKSEKNAERVAQWRDKQLVTKNVTHYNDITLQDCNIAKVKETKVKESKVGFVRPELFEVQNYFEEVGNLTEAEGFFNYYESNGWKVGKNPMKDWKAASRNWIKNSKNYTKNVTTKSSSDIYAERRAELHQYTDKIDFLRGIRP